MPYCNQSHRIPLHDICDVTDEEFSLVLVSGCLQLGIWELGVWRSGSVISTHRSIRMPPPVVLHKLAAMHAPYIFQEQNTAAGP